MKLFEIVFVVLLFSSTYNCDGSGEQNNKNSPRKKTNVRAGCRKFIKTKSGISRQDTINSISESTPEPSRQNTIPSHLLDTVEKFFKDVLDSVTNLPNQEETYDEVQKILTDFPELKERMQNNPDTDQFSFVMEPLEQSPGKKVSSNRVSQSPSRKEVSSTFRDEIRRFVPVITSKMENGDPMKSHLLTGLSMLTVIEELCKNGIDMKTVTVDQLHRAFRMMSNNLQQEITVLNVFLETVTEKVPSQVASADQCQKIKSFVNKIAGKMPMYYEPLEYHLSSTLKLLDLYERLSPDNWAKNQENLGDDAYNMWSTLNKGNYLIADFAVSALKRILSNQIEN